MRVRASLSHARGGERTGASVGAERAGSGSGK